jgi:type I restriction enzyme S subunit
MEWKWVMLKDAVQLLDNLRKPINLTERQFRIEGKKESELFPYYGATGQIGWIDNYITEGEYVLVGEDGAPFLDIFKEKAYKIKGKTWVNNHAHILKEISGLTYNDFILHYLNSIDYRQYVNGTTRLKLTKGSLVNIPFPIPALPIQRAIVSKIDELFSELDKGIESLRLAQQQLKTYRQSVLKWAFEGRLTNENVKDGELPEGWKVSTLGQCLENISSGKSYRCVERPPKKDEVGILKVSSVTWGFFDEMESKTCFSIDFLNEKYLVKKGDFLFSRANTIELIGACVIVDNIENTIMLSDKILRFVFTKDILKEYALYFLRSRKGRKQIEKLSTGNQDSMRNIGQEKIRQIEFPFCLIKEQRNIVEAIESRLSIADKMEESIIKRIRQAEALRQSILKKAFEGRLLN